MGCFHIVWNYGIKLPFVEKLHEVLHAFLRTSEQGEWRPDDRKLSDAFVLHYRRGKWKSPHVGTDLAPDKIVPDDPASAAMELEIKLRPSPVEISISMCHKLYWDDYRRHSRTSQASGERQFANRVAKEVKALAAYLQQVYELTETPQAVFVP
jgi:hypothetical protein